MGLFAVALRMKQLVTGPTPPAGANALYFKGDDKIYTKTSGGTEHQLIRSDDGRLSDSRTPTAHDHNDLYYTETEADARFTKPSDWGVVTQVAEDTHTETTSPQSWPDGLSVMRVSSGNAGWPVSSGYGLVETVRHSATSANTNMQTFTEWWVVNPRKWYRVATGVNTWGSWQQVMRSGDAPAAHTHDDRYYTETESDGRFANRASETISVPASTDAAWYRIATTSGSGRAFGRFVVSTSASSRHDTVEFTAAMNFGAGPSLNIESFSRYSTAALLEVRIVGGSSAQLQHVEVRLQNTHTGGMSVLTVLTNRDNVSAVGWDLESAPPVVDAVPVAPYVVKTSSTLAVATKTINGQAVVLANDPRLLDPAHTHDDRYFTESESNSRFIRTDSTSQNIDGIKTFLDIPRLSVAAAKQIIEADLTSQSLKMLHDRVRFTNPFYFTSTDGVVYTAAPAGVGREIFAGRSDYGHPILATAPFVRWEWSGMEWSSCDRLRINFGYTTPAPSVTVTVRSSVDGVSWTTRGTQVIGFASANSWVVPFSSFSGDSYLRVEMAFAGGPAGSGNIARIASLEVQTGRLGDQGLGFEAEMPFSWDWQRLVQFRNHTFPSANNAYDLGVGTNRWRKLYVVDADFSGAVAFNTLPTHGGQALVRTDDSRLSDSRNPTAHTHDDRYYTETETNTLLAGKAASSHTHVKADVGLSNVDNTSDANKPVSTAQQTALNGKANTSHTHVKADVGLSNVDNTADSAKPVSTAQQTALNLKLNASEKGAASGVAPLTSSSKVPMANLSTDTGFGVPALDGSGLVKPAQLPTTPLSKGGTNRDLSSGSANGQILALSSQSIGQPPTEVINLGSGAEGDILASQGPGEFPQWVAGASMSGVPVGATMMWMGTNAPAGWLLLDGSEYSGAQYPGLYAIFGGMASKYGYPQAGPVDPFKLPNMTQKFPRGADVVQGSSNTTGNSGGSPTITTAQMPAHDHELTFSSATGSSQANIPRGTATEIGRGRGAIVDEGGGAAYWQPYIDVQFIIKAG